MPIPDISIIIPHLNNSEWLAKCLASLAAQTHPAERIEIIVVDNGSRELPRALVAQFANVTLAEERVPGPGPARNLGAALAHAPLFAFINSDCLADRAWVAAIVARFANDPQMQVIGGDVRVFPRIAGNPTPSEAYEMLYAFRQERQIARQKFSVTANLATRRAVFDAVGPFAGIDVAEDLDWGKRAARLGYRTHYAPEVVVQHPARAGIDTLRERWDRHTSHHFRQHAKGFGGHVRWAVCAGAMAISPLVELPHVLTADKLSSRSERGKALQGLFAVRLYRARRMLLSLVDPDVRKASRQWNRNKHTEGPRSAADQ